MINNQLNNMVGTECVSIPYRTMAFRPGLAAASSRPSPSSSYLSPQGRAIVGRATSTSTAATTAAADHANLLKKAATYVSFPIHP